MCFCVAFVSLSVYLSQSETTCSQIGLVEKRRRRRDQLEKKEEEEEISNMGIACYLRLWLVCVCIVLLLLSLSISDFFSLSKLESLFLSLLIHGFDFSWVRLFMGSIHRFMGSIHEFDSWVHAISRILIHGFMGLIFLGSWV